MNPEARDVLILHLVGVTGVLLNLAMSSSPLSAVRSARKAGSLGGLDTSSWPIFYSCQLTWTLYACHTGDVWLFIAASVATIIWLWFNLTAIELLAQEAGEIEFMPKKTWEGGLMHCKTMNLDSLCKKHRGASIQYIENLLLAGSCYACLLTFLCSEWTILGLESLNETFTPDFKLQVFTKGTAATTVICYGKPVTRMYKLMKRRDAQSIFLPLVLGSLLNSASWTIYMFIAGNKVAASSTAIGALVAIVQVVLKVAYGSQAADESLERNPDEIKGVSIIPNGCETKSSEKSDTGSTTDHDDCSMSMSSDSIPEIASVCVASVSQNRSTVSVLPDLTDRLKEQEVYEDYLKWQQNYRDWRQGSARGAHGELSNIR